MRFSLCLGLMIFLLLVAGCAPAPAVESVVCNAPYIRMGNGCCLDSNTNSICDSDEVAPAESASPEPSSESTNMTESEKRLLATNFALQVARLWESGKWSELYDLLPNEEKAALTEKEFSFFMNITSYETRSLYDQDFQATLYDGVYNFDRREKMRVQVSDVLMLDANTAATLASEVTFNDVPMWDWEGLTFIWEDNQWKFKTIGEFFVGSDATTVCPALKYEYRCFHEYAKAFGDISYCDKAGYYIFDCYTSFKKDVPQEKSMAACKTYPLDKEKDECLLNIVFKSKTDLCEGVKLSQNKYICYGLIAGQTINLDGCMSKISDSELFDAKQNREAQCIYGYVWVTKEKDLCRRIGEHASTQITTDCFNLVFPYD